MARTALITSILCCFVLTSRAAAQRLTPETREGVAQAQFTITGKIGKKSFHASGSGVCQHAADASIRGISASLWMVRFDGSGEGKLRRLNMTLWRPKDGGSDQLSLEMATGSGDHRIDTGGDGKRKGEGSVTIIPNGPGGRLELNGKESEGKPVQLTIECPSFAGVEAEGG